MISGWFRIGSWEYLKWKHVIPIKVDHTGQVMAAKMIIYTVQPESESIKEVNTIKIY
jgi:hypothetical protein